MTTITVDNDGDAPVAGETDLRQAVAQAANGDTIVFASAGSGSTTITLNAPLAITPDVDIEGFTSNPNLGTNIQGSLTIPKGSSVTMVGVSINGGMAGTDATTNGTMGANGAQGMGGMDGEDAGQSGTPGSGGGAATAGSGASADATRGTPALENDGTLTLVQSYVNGTSSGGAGGVGGHGGGGGDGGLGGSGQSGQPDPREPDIDGGAGAIGGSGGLGGVGGPGTNGADAVGGVINTGNLTLQDSVIHGIAQGGAGGAGGAGGQGGYGGAGGDGGGGFNGGGAGGIGGNGASGGNAVGGLLNTSTGTVRIVGAAALDGDSATGGTPGDGGMGGDGGLGGAAGTPGGGDLYMGHQGTDGAAGTDGADGRTAADGAAGAPGSATTDVSDQGTTSGTYTVNGRIFDLDARNFGQGSNVTIQSGAPTKFTYSAQSFAVNPTAGTVGWKVVPATGGPLPTDFVGPTSGTLNFQAGTPGLDNFSVQLNADAAAPRNESFTVELVNPSTGNVIGSAGTYTQNVTNLAAPLCFVAGTSIRTVRGEVAVEHLQVGDRVVTANGALRPIVWLGRRRLDLRRGHGRQAAWPVRILAGAFGGGLPRRDLALSPGHPVLVGADADGEGGVLVPIMCLVNGTSIGRVEVDAVTYWHVELDEHDILLAEGLAAESYIECGDRAFFDGADGPLADPDLVVPGLGARCRPVVVDGAVLDAERQRLDAAFATRLSAACAWPEAAPVV